MPTHADLYFVTESGMTPLRPLQRLREDELNKAEDRFGAPSFVVQTAADVLDEWLTAPISMQKPAYSITRLLILDALLSADSPYSMSPRLTDTDIGSATVAGLCRRAIAYIERLGRLREIGAPEIVLRNERRMLRATARALRAAVGGQDPLQAAIAVFSNSTTPLSKGEAPMKTSYSNESKQDVCRTSQVMTAAALAAALLASAATPIAAQDSGYVPQFTQDGQLILPKAEVWRTWPYIGTPLTPNALNGGTAPFPEFHSVYIDPVSFEHWRKTGEFRDGTVLAKELVTVINKDAHPDGSTNQVSGRGYFMGEFVGFEIAHKSAKHFPKEPGNWAYFSFGHHAPPYAASTKKMPVEACAACHQVSAATLAGGPSSKIVGAPRVASSPAMVAPSTMLGL